MKMVFLLLDLIGMIIVHLAIVAVLGLIGMFVWNTGIVGIATNLPTISFMTASAIMLGLYVLNLIAKTWIARIRYLKHKPDVEEFLHMANKVTKEYNKKTKG